MKRINRTGYFKAILLLLMMLPLWVVALYSLPAADDFSNSVNLARNAGQMNYLKIIWEECKRIYTGWQGTFTSCIWLYTLQPFYWFGKWGIRIFCIANIVFYFICLLYLVRSMTKLVFKESSCFILYIALTFLCTNIHSVAETFYWYTGACVYTIPLSLAFLGTGLLISFWQEKKRGKLIAACVCGFLSAGGSLQITAIICFVYLFVFLLAMYTRHEGMKETGIAFGVTLVSGLINAFAPGNFVRHTALSGTPDLSILRSVKYSVSVTVNQLGKVLAKGEAVLLLLAIFLWALYYFSTHRSEKKDMTHPCIFGALGCIGIAITVFPICLGYSHSNLTDRNLFVLNVYIILLVTCFLIYLARYSVEKLDLHISRQMIFYWGIGICAAFFMSMNFVDYDSLPVMESVKSLDEISERSKCWEEILSAIERSEDRNVVIETEKCEDIPVIKNVGLTEYESDWVNESIANYYNRESVKVSWIE